MRRFTGIVIEAYGFEYFVLRGSSFGAHPRAQVPPLSNFIDNLFGVLRARNPKLNKQDALWNAEIVLTALKGFLPTLAGCKTSVRSRTIDTLNQMRVR